MPTDLCLAHIFRRDWLTDGPLNDLLALYVKTLQEQRYARNTVNAYLRCLAHFSYWMRGERLVVADIDRPLIKRFLGHHLSTCTCPAPCRSEMKEMRATLHHLLELLPHVEKEITTSTWIEAELAHFDDYLRHTCGLASLTCTQRCQHVALFLTHCFSNTPLKTERLVADDINNFLEGLAVRWKPASRKVICTSLRSYFRFRRLQGDDTRMLSASLPLIADWPRRHPPKILTESQIEHFLHAFDLTDPVGLRDHAIAHFLLDLGLRGDETTHLALDDLNWRDGTVMLRRTKSQRVQHLPLPEKTGEALVHYLREGRPHTDSRILFIRHRAPFGVPLSVAAIRGAMTRAFARCGLADQFCSTHVLRRSMASRLQKAGVSIKEVADLLRHRDINTARVYARVDFNRLQTVALSWPGSAS